MPIFWRNKLILAKIEATEGVDSGPGSADAMLLKDVTLSPMEGQDLSRDLEAVYFGSQGTVPLDLHAKLEFSVELAGSGTPGTAPAWGPLLRACAVAETIDAGASVTYNPITDGQESITLHFFNGATRYVLLGSRGTASFDLSASGIPMIKFTLTGLFTLPSEQTPPAADYSAFERPVEVTTARTPTVTLGGTAMVMRSFMLDLANQVEPRFLVGSNGILITDRADKVEMQVEAVPLTTFNPVAAAFNQTELDVTVVHGTQAGNITTINVPRGQMQRPGGLTQVQNITEWPLNIVPVPDTGNDQWTLTLT